MAIFATVVYANSALIQNYHFLPRDAMLSAMYAVVVCLCVCLSVCQK